MNKRAALDSIPSADMVEETINWMIKAYKANTNKISDGYHSFGELYDHRIALYMVLCKVLASENIVWKSKTHHDGTSWDGWFIMGIGTHKGSQISYHLPMEYWDLCKFADTHAEAPEFDGHTSQDVYERLKSLI